MAMNGKNAIQPIEEELKRKLCATSSTRSLNTINTGLRGYKDQRQDIEEAIKSLRRQLEIIDEWA